MGNDAGIAVIPYTWVSQYGVSPSAILLQYRLSNCIKYRACDGQKLDQKHYGKEECLARIAL